MRRLNRTRRATTLISLLVVIAIIGILVAVMSTALQGVKGTGPGGTAPNSMSNFEDRHNLSQIFQGMMMDATMGQKGMPMPSAVANGSKSLDTSANFWSMLIAQNTVYPQMLISGAEQSMLVNEILNYNRNAYNPSQGQYWDPNFKADLQKESHVSFAHMPLLGDRVRKNWVVGGPAMFPMMGNRGPKDGVPDPNSWTCDPATGQWKGNIVFGDGHIDYLQTMTPPNVQFNQRNQWVQDNIFALEDGYRGGDGIITFTRSINDSSFEMQFD